MKSLISKIANIRNESEETKKKILWIMVFLCMLMVFGIWIYTFIKTPGDLKEHNSNFKEGMNYGNLTAKISDLEEKKNNALESIEYEIEKAEFTVIAEEYIKDNDLLEGGEFENLKLEDARKWNNNWHLSYKQYYNEVPVEGSGGILTLDVQTKAIVSSEINYYKDIDVDTVPKIDEENALERIREFEKADYVEKRKGELVIYRPLKENIYHLSWKLNVAIDPASENRYFVDAESGKILKSLSLMKE